MTHYCQQFELLEIYSDSTLWFLKYSHYCWQRQYKKEPLSAPALPALVPFRVEVAEEEGSMILLHNYNPMAGWQ